MNNTEAALDQLELLLNNAPKSKSSKSSKSSSSLRPHSTPTGKTGLEQKPVRLKPREGSRLVDHLSVADTSDPKSTNRPRAPINAGSRRTDKKSSRRRSREENGDGDGSGSGSGSGSGRNGRDGRDGRDGRRGSRGGGGGERGPERRGERRIRRSQSSQLHAQAAANERQSNTLPVSLEDSWKSLEHFRKTSRDSPLKSLDDDANTSGIHFLNVESDAYQNERTETRTERTKSTDVVHIDHSNNSNNSSNSSNSSNKTPVISHIIFHDDGNDHISPSVSSSPPTASSLMNTPMFERRDVVEVANQEGRGRHQYTTVASTDFVIPELPRGRQLTINILSTWGDAHYVGLMGIELFDSSGHRIHVLSKSVVADPPDINVLQEYTNDPRTADKLFDGINHTCDDLHCWLAPYNQGDNHFIFVGLQNSSVVSGRSNGSSTTNSSNEDNNNGACLSMMRIWNYNKSRIHSYRGARYVEIKLDDRFIFKGEIQRAPGAMLGSTACSECILFTNNIRILKIIERYDKEPEGRDKYQHRVVGWSDSDMNVSMQRIGTGRPGKSIGANNKNIDDADWRQGWGGGTSGERAGNSRGSSRGSTNSRGGIDSPPKSFFNPASMYERPNTAGSTPSSSASTSASASASPSSSLAITATATATNHLTIASRTKPLNVRSDATTTTTPTTSDSLSLSGRKVIQPPKNRKRRPIRPKTAPLNRDGSINTPHVGRILEMVFLSNWGDPTSIGLTGFQVMDANFKAIPLSPSMLTLWSADQQVQSDALSCLIDEETTTTDVNHMWCVPPVVHGGSVKNSRYRLVVNLGTNVSILGLVVWNYNGNANVEETYCGVKRMTITFDGVEKSPPMLGTLIRKGPGSSSFNFGQFVNLNNSRVPELTPKKSNYNRTSGCSQQQQLQQERPGRPGPSPLSNERIHHTPKRQHLDENHRNDRVVMVSSSSSSSTSSTSFSSSSSSSSSRAKNTSNTSNTKKDGLDEMKEWGWSSSTTGVGSFSASRSRDQEKHQVTASAAATLMEDVTFIEEKDGGETVFDVMNDVRQQYECPTEPTGCIFKFILLSTHGDPHYIGLNGLEIYDENNVKIELDETNVEVKNKD